LLFNMESRLVDGSDRTEVSADADFGKYEILND
jgi:hypothetical protein